METNESQIKKEGRKKQYEGDECNEKEKQEKEKVMI